MTKLHYWVYAKGKYKEEASKRNLLLMSSQILWGYHFDIYDDIVLTPYVGTQFIQYELAGISNKRGISNDQNGSTHTVNVGTRFNKFHDWSHNIRLNSFINANAVFFVKQDADHHIYHDLEYNHTYIREHKVRENYAFNFGFGTELKHDEHFDLIGSYNFKIRKQFTAHIMSLKFRYSF